MRSARSPATPPSVSQRSIRGHSCSPTNGASTMESIVPLAGPMVKGPLGVAHLPRLWLKAVLASANALPDGYRTGYDGTDKIALDGVGLDPQATFAYLETQPAYMAFEVWLREHA